MNEEVRIRTLAAQDYEPVVALWRRCEGIEVAEGDDPGSFRAYLERNPGLSGCAEARGAIVGAVLCGHDGRRGLIYHLAVAPEFRGRGLGKALVERGIAGLKERGIARALILVAKDNAAGEQFWLAQGFEAIAGARPLGMDLR